MCCELGHVVLYIIHISCGRLLYGNMARRIQGDARPRYQRGTLCIHHPYSSIVWVSFVYLFGTGVKVKGTAHILLSVHCLKCDMKVWTPYLA